MAKHKLTIQKNESLKFYKVTCPEGDYITDYDSSKMRPMEYYGTTEIYAPDTMTEEEIQSIYYCITEEEHLTNCAAAEEDHKKWEAENFEIEK